MGKVSNVFWYEFNTLEVEGADGITATDTPNEPFDRQGEKEKKENSLFLVYFFWQKYTISR